MIRPSQGDIGVLGEGSRAGFLFRGQGRRDGHIVCGGVFPPGIEAPERRFRRKAFVESDQHVQRAGETGHGRRCIEDRGETAAAAVEEHFHGIAGLPMDLRLFLDDGTRIRTAFLGRGEDERLRRMDPLGFGSGTGGEQGRAQADIKNSSVHIQFVPYKNKQYPDKRTTYRQNKDGLI